MSHAWMRSALCRCFPDLPWIEEPHRRSRAGEVVLESVCGACSVHSECRAYVERVDIVSGYWAGEDRTPPSELSDSGGAA